MIISEGVKSKHEIKPTTKNTENGAPKHDNKLPQVGYLQLQDPLKDLPYSLILFFVDFLFMLVG